MGLKRPFDAEEMQECNAKHSRQLSYSPNHLNISDQSIPYHVPLDKTAVLVEKDIDTCAPFSWISTGLCQEEHSSLSHESSGSDFTWRPLSPVEDVYTCLMNQPPRKQVLVGSNHQADIPECEILVQTNVELERKLMGKCIIPMPADSDLCGAGQGRKECLCLDKGTVRCVRRHIMEARESLIEAIGYERFMEIGLCEMGDEVISLWSEDEEDLFHKLVYSNPVSLGRDFWKQLKATFPSRTMTELVSYYFNVFILRRRATQNRLKTLDVDSDDDEWQVEYDVFCSGKSVDEEEDDDGDTSSREEEEETNNSDGDEEDSPDNNANCVYMDKFSRDSEVDVEDDSCMSLELQDSNLIFPPRESNRGGGEDMFSFDDACDRRLTSSSYCWTKNNDLLPTSNIIEEIFGQDEWGEIDDNLKGK